MQNGKLGFSEKAAPSQNTAGEIFCFHLLDSIPFPVFYLDRDLVFTQCNRAAAAALLHPVEEIIGRSLDEVVSGKEDIVREVREVRHTGEPLSALFASIRHGTPDGERQYQVSLLPDRGEDSLLRGILVVGEDITERKGVEKALRFRLELERIIMMISTNFIKLPSDEIDSGILDALRLIGEFARVDRSYVFLFREDGKIMDNTHEWCAEGVAPQIHRLKGIHADRDLPWFSRRIKGREIVHIPSVADLPPEARAEKEEFEREAIKSLITVPMVQGDTLIGFLGLDSVRAGKEWSEDSIALLRIVGEIFANALQRKRAEETIRFQTYHDLLTGLPNRTMLMDRLSLEIPQMQHSRKRIAVLLIGIDRFKNINDSLGHAVGDALLKDIAARLKTRIHEYDMVARMGGDEFMVLLPFIDYPEDVARAAEKIMDAFKDPFLLGAHTLHVTASIGISLYPEDGENAEVLVRNADIALYHAKSQGRNNYQFYNSSINVRTLERILLENRLRQTIEQGELEIRYQPQMEIKTKRIVGAEALVRWKHPDLGLLTPGRFIPLAEEAGLVISIDQWVLHRTCAQMKAWQQAGFPSFSISVNLSARQFQQKDLAETISRVLRENALSPESLGVEITESLAMQDTELTARNLRMLSAIGVRFSIDDFGTGYSSLSYLKKIPFHKLKIDKSFIINLAEDQDYQSIIRAIIDMAHGLKLKVVAEGVETEEQLSFLRTSHCDEIQGHFFSKPLSAEDFEKFVLAHT
ncbi:MAG: EAL domain-containing protein [Alphaproteobacteria bacterium]|uniref:EAL domain-containing protein n=1 Tax=Candidatus Nitrobium versatile TaxID=2884831 RepID=A0A953SIJ8_9BACT|nr:EAL domain-containing protein [Candidatus Nitrobium versatile]